MARVLLLSVAVGSFLMAVTSVGAMRTMILAKRNEYE